jgi:hypothetical protein
MLTNSKTTLNYIREQPENPRVVFGVQPYYKLSRSTDCAKEVMPLLFSPLTRFFHHPRSHPDDEVAKNDK